MCYFLQMKLLAFQKITALMELITEVRTNCLYDAMKANVKVIVIAALIRNLVIRLGDCHLHTRQMYLQNIIPSPHYIGGRMGPRAGLDNLI
jgi:hypothetical protein